MKVKLGDYVLMVQEREVLKKVDTSKYVSTENILADRNGVKFPANTIPLSKTITTYKKDDILISNIRPYFKKIWKAEFDGPKSNDVIAFRTKDSRLLQDYLYVVLQSDNFFNYVTNTAKGTKMPRGDKKAIINYEFELPNIQLQRKISHTILVLEKKIRLNNQINDNLISLAIALFNKYFPNINSGNEMIGNFISNYDRLRKPLSKKERLSIPGKYRYIGATSVNDYINKYNFDGIYLLLGEDGTVEDDNGYPILQYISGKFWPNNHAHVLQGKNVSTEWLYLFFKQRKITSIVTGAVQKKISQKNLNSLSISIPDKDKLARFDTIINPIFKNIRIIESENHSLEKIKVELLSKLF